jgi:hypothetical protein
MVLSQFNPPPICTTCLRKIHLNVTLSIKTATTNEVRELSLRPEEGFIDPKHVAVRHDMCK